MALARDAAASSRKRAQISSCLKKHELISLGKGAWLCFRNTEIVSGFVVEGSPLDTYISTFVLPSFDRHTFVSWSLGRRVVHCSLGTDVHGECGLAVSSFISDLGSIKSSDDLLTYLDEFHVSGHYPIWVRYICYLKLLNFNSAIHYLDEAKRAQLHVTQLERYEEIKEFVTAHDGEGVLKTFERWSRVSEQVFGSFDQDFAAF